MMIEITEGVNQLFRTRWRSLHTGQWANIDLLQFPGVYLLAYDARALEGQRVRVDDIYYVGMSNSAGGVRARLKQFKSALEKGGRHSGGNHCYKQNKQTPFSELPTRKKFYFTAWCLRCDSLKRRAKPDDFRKMGMIACLEYYAIAHVLAKSTTKKVPPLNRSAGGILVGPE